MKSSITVNTTEARNNFFKLLQAVTDGADVTVVKRDSKTRFKLVLDTNPAPSKKALMAKWRSLHLQAPSPTELKKIILSKYEK